MAFIFILIALLTVIFMLYKRYIPGIGLQSTSLKVLDTDSVTVVDVRDFNDFHRNPIQHALNIPIPYLKRYMHEIEGNTIHLVVSNTLEKNLATHYFKKQKCKVVGYTMIGETTIRHHHRCASCHL